MSFSFVDEPEEELPASFSFVEEEENPTEPKKKKKVNKGSLHEIISPTPDAEHETPFTPFIKSVARGVGTTVADIGHMINNQQRSNPGSLHNLINGMPEEQPEPEWATKLREELPEESEDSEYRFIERMAKNASRPESLIFGPLGAALSAGSAVVGQGIKELGGGETAQHIGEVGFGLGLGGGSAIAAARGRPAPPASATNRGGMLAKAEVRTTPKQVEQRLQNITKEKFAEYDRKTADLAEPFDRGEFNARDVANDLEQVTIKHDLDTIAPKAETKQEFGKNLQENIEFRFDEAEANYKPLYNAIENVSKNIEVNAESTIQLVKETRAEIEALKTRPANYDTVIKALDTIEQDLGAVKPAPGEGIQILDQHGNPIEGKAVTENIPLSKQIELGRRINKIINYDIMEPQIKDRLKPVNRRIKAEIRNELGKVDPAYASTFDLAEKQFGETAAKFGRKSVERIRKLEPTERAAAIIESPTTLEDLKQVLSPEQYGQVERQVLEQINQMGPESAAKTFKEVSPHLSQNAKTAGENIVQFKDPKHFTGNWNKYAQMILNDVQDSLTTGAKPTKTLKLMQNRAGYQTVYETLHNTPKGQQALKYLEKQYVDDMISTTVDSKTGNIDWNALSRMMEENPTNKLIARRVVGKEGVKEIKKLQQYAENMQYNFEKYSKPEQSIGQKLLSEGVNHGLMPIFIAASGGGLPLAGLAAIGTKSFQFSKFLTRRMLASPKMQEGMRKLADPKVWEKGRQQAVAQGILKAANEED